MRYSVRYDQKLNSRMRGDSGFSRLVDECLGPAKRFPALVIEAGERRGFRPGLDHPNYFLSGVETLNEGGCGNTEFCEKFRSANRIRFKITFIFPNEAAFVTAVFYKGNASIYVLNVRFGRDGKARVMPTSMPHKKHSRQEVDVPGLGTFVEVH